MPRRSPSRRSPSRRRTRSKRATSSQYRSATFRFPAKFHFPGDVFLDLLDIQHKSWKGIDPVNNLLKLKKVNFDGAKEIFDDLVEIEKGAPDLNLCNIMIDKMQRVTHHDVSYELVMDILEHLIELDDYVGHNIPVKEIPNQAQRIKNHMESRLGEIKPAAKPWLLVTVGVPGVGKGNVLKKAQQYFPSFEGLGSRQYFKCDPDSIYETLRAPIKEKDSDRPTRDFVNYWNHVSFGVALKKKSNIVFDGSGRESKNICGRVIARALKKKYQIGFLVVTLPMTRIIGQIYERDHPRNAEAGVRQTALNFVQDTAVSLLYRVPEYMLYSCIPKQNIVFIENNRTEPRRVHYAVVAAHLAEWNTTALTDIQNRYNKLVEIQERHDSMTTNKKCAVEPESCEQKTFEKGEFPWYLYFHLDKLKTLHLNGIDGVGMQAFASAVASGSLPQLQVLRVYHSQIGDVGMKAFASASRSLPQLQTLSLFHNQIGDGGMQAFASAVASGSLPKLETLYLYSNSIGDGGMKAFASAVASGSLPQLRDLRLFHNKIGDGGMKAFASAVVNGSLASLKKIVVDDVRHPQLMAACQARGIEIV